MFKFIKKGWGGLIQWLRPTPAIHISTSSSSQGQPPCDFCQGTGLVERQEPTEMYIPSRYREYSPPVALHPSKPCPKCLGKGV